MARRLTFPTEEERFFKYIHKREDGCWIWTAKTLSKGQGMFKFEGKFGLAHHYAWKRWKGPIEKYARIYHSCQQLNCVNPDHLFCLTEEERFWAFVDQSNREGCWAWKGSERRGYPVFDSVTTKANYAHCYIWIIQNGPIPEGYDIHHRCQNSRCVRPDHLEAVSRRTHVIELSPNNLAFQNFHKTHCKRGHPFDEINTYIIHKQNGKIARHCRTCKHLQSQKYRRNPNLIEENHANANTPTRSHLPGRP